MDVSLVSTIADLSHFCCCHFPLLPAPSTKQTSRSPGHGALRRRFQQTNLGASPHGESHFGSVIQWGTFFYVVDKISMRWTKNLEIDIKTARVLSFINSKFIFSINEHSDIREVFQGLPGNLFP